MIALKNKKFLTGFCALIVAVAMISVGVTLAANEISKSETNIVVFGNVDIELIDDYPDTPPSVEPTGAEVNKKVSVKNTGNHDCYVRILVNKSWLDTEGTSIASKIDLDSYINWDCWFTEDSAKTTIDSVEYQIYYYNEILKPNEEAEPLFTKFAVDNYTAIADKVVGTDGHIKVLAQAVQAGDEVKVTNVGGGGPIEKAVVGGTVYVVNWTDEIAKFKGDKVQANRNKANKMDGFGNAIFLGYLYPDMDAKYPDEDEWSFDIDGYDSSYEPQSTSFRFELTASKDLKSYLEGEELANYPANRATVDHGYAGSIALIDWVFVIPPEEIKAPNFPTPDPTTTTTTKKPTPVVPGTGDASIPYAAASAACGISALVIFFVAFGEVGKKKKEEE